MCENKSVKSPILFFFLIQIFQLKKFYIRAINKKSTEKAFLRIISKACVMQQKTEK